MLSNLFGEVLLLGEGINDGWKKNLHEEIKGAQFWAVREQFVLSHV
jgi:hypothetical protein